MGRIEGLGMAGLGVRRAVMAAIVASGAVAAIPAHAGSGPSAQTLDLLSDAIRRGYGDMCDLEGGKAEKDGYFRCVDVGPYRFSFGDRRVEGYVVLKGAAPYRFMGAGDGDGVGYITGGPWETDLDDKVARWYADEVGGGRARREAEQGDADRAQAARAAVEGYGGGAPATAPLDRPQPQAGYPLAYPQARYAQPGYPYPPPPPQGGPRYQAVPTPPPVTYSPPSTAGGPDAFPLAVPNEDGSLAAPPGGTLIAPGVVQYGRGRAPSQ